LRIKNEVRLFEVIWSCYNDHEKAEGVTMTEYIQASKFKARCLKLMDKVHRTKRRIVITKRNKAIAQLVPIEEDSSTLFGRMTGTVHVIGDIISPIDEVWDASR
jgi:prevent-host-death family protein